MTILRLFIAGAAIAAASVVHAESVRVENGVRVHYGDPIARPQPESSSFAYEVRIDPGYRGTDLYEPKLSDSGWSDGCFDWGCGYSGYGGGFDWWDDRPIWSGFSTGHRHFGRSFIGFGRGVHGRFDGHSFGGGRGFGHRSFAVGSFSRPQFHQPSGPR